MIVKITVLFNHVSTYCVQLGESTGVVRVQYVRTCKTRLDTTTKFMVVVTSLFNLVISSFPDNMFNMYEHDFWFIMVTTTLFWSVRLSSHEQSVSTYMKKSVNNHVQADKLHHVQACQQAKTSCAFLHVYVVRRYTTMYVVRRLRYFVSWNILLVN